MNKTAFPGETTQNPSVGWTSLADVPDSVAVQPVELKAEDGATTRGILYVPKAGRPRVGVHLMHPRTDQSTNYNILPLARAGYAVLGRAGRWPNNDSATIHEHLLLDMAAGIRHLRNLGCEQVVLLGNSGGSSLAAFYQAQACMPKGQRLTDTAAGDPLDLNAYDLPPADGIVLIGAHIGQGGIMRKLIDPSVVDESDPLASDPTLDMFLSENGFRQPPQSSRYEADFLERYRSAQGARVRRIDAKAWSFVNAQRDAAAVVAQLGEKAPLHVRRLAHFEPHMIIYRTTAYPAFADTHIEPDGREVFSYYKADLEFENFEGNGFGRYITPRAWLSTWSENHSRARTIANLALQDRPLLVVHYSGDCGTRLSEAQAMFDASPSAVKDIQMVHGADHYGLRIVRGDAPRPRIWEGTQIVTEWMLANFRP